MIKQPEKSRLCGQCCLGIILDISLEESINLLGHKHATKTKEIIRHFKTNTDKLTRRYLPDYALCRVHFGKEKNTHWVIYKNGEVYDPIIGEWISLSEWNKITSEDGARITSSIKILDKKL